MRPASSKKFRAFSAHKVNALPVITGKGRVIGMASEADVLRKQEQNFAS